MNDEYNYNNQDDPAFRRPPLNAPVQDDPRWDTPPQSDPMWQQDPQGGAGKAIASMVLGIVTIVLSCCFPYLTIPAAIIGLVLGILSLRRLESGRGMALAGVIMCGIAVLLGIILLIMMVIGLSTYNWTEIINQNTDYF